MKRLTRHGLYALFLVFVAVVSTEVLLRSFFFDPDRYYVFPPGQEMVFKPSPETTPGVSGDGWFRINSLGLRGREPSAADRFRILAIGGSTTESTYLDQDETWPHVLEGLINRDHPAIGAWVGNAGKSGAASPHHILHVRHLVPQVDGVDLIIVFLGANDATAAIGWSVPKGQAQELLWSTAFTYRPRPRDSWSVADTATARFVDHQWTTFQRLRTGVVQTQSGDWMDDLRRIRRRSAFTDDLPDLSDALDRYRRNLVEIVEEGRRQGVPVVLMTQPTMWRGGLSEAEDARLYLATTTFFGHLDQTENPVYYTPRAMGQIIDGFNDAVRRVCSKFDLTCIDAARELPQDFRYFYDDMHLSEEGARRLAAIVLTGIRPLVDRLGQANPES